MDVQSVLGKLIELVSTLILLYFSIFALNFLWPDIGGPAWNLLNSFLNVDFLILLIIIFFLAILTKGDE